MIEERAGGLRPVVALLVVLASLVVSFCLAEIASRLVGRQPWSPLVDRQKEPTLVEPEPRLGWVNKAGVYRVPSFLAGGDETDLTILDDGSRATGAAVRGAEGAVVFVGCSFTEGSGLSDRDTFAWKIQQAHRELHVVNFGTPGYGTLQSLMRMESVLEQSKPRLILYDFLTLHEPRNVATYYWLRSLARHSQRGHVAPPYVTLDGDDGLVRHPPTSYAVWPLAGWLVTMRMAGDAYMHAVTYGRDAQASEATKRLMLEMERLARRHGVAFRVVFLFDEGGKKNEYVDYFQRHEVPFVDCIQPLADGDRIPGDGHPNARINSLWAQCISEKVPELGH